LVYRSHAERRNDVQLNLCRPE